MSKNEADLSEAENGDDDDDVIIVESSNKRKRKAPVASSHRSSKKQSQNSSYNNQSKVRDFVLFLFDILHVIICDYSSTESERKQQQEQDFTHFKVCCATIT